VQDNVTLVFGELPMFLEPLAQSVLGAASDLECAEASNEDAQATMKEMINHWASLLLPEEATVTLMDLAMYATSGSAPSNRATSTPSLVDDIQSVLVVQWQCLLREVDALSVGAAATEASFVRFARTTNSLCWTGELLANLCFDANEFESANCYVEACLKWFREVEAVSATFSLDHAPQFEYLRRQSSTEIHRVTGHDGMLRIGDSKTVWKHLLGSYARIRFCQAEHARRRNSEVEAVMVLFEEAISAFERLPNTDRQKRGICRCHQGMCDLRRRVLNPQDQGAVNDLLAAYDQVIDLARQTGDQCLEATQLKNQGIGFSRLEP
jgi:hypothetical protein